MTSDIRVLRCGRRGCIFLVLFDNNHDHIEGVILGNEANFGLAQVEGQGPITRSIWQTFFSLAVSFLK